MVILIIFVLTKKRIPFLFRFFTKATMQVETRSVTSNDPRDWSQTFQKTTITRHGVFSPIGEAFHTWEQLKRNTTQLYDLRYPPVPTEARFNKVKELRALKHATARHRYHRAISTAPAHVPLYRLPMLTTAEEVEKIMPIATQDVNTIRRTLRPFTAPVVSKNNIAEKSIPVNMSPAEIRVFEQGQLEELLRKGSYVPKDFGIISKPMEKVVNYHTIDIDKRFFRMRMFAPRPQMY